MPRHTPGRAAAGRLLLLVALFAATGHAQFRIENGRLSHNGAPFTVRGVAYGNASIGRGPSSTLDESPCLYARDFPLIRAMGANTIRTIGLPRADDSAFRKGLADNDLYWLAGFPLTPYQGGGASLSPATEEGRALRARILEDFRAFVAAWRGEDRLIAFVFGEDAAVDYGAKFRGSPGDFNLLLHEASNAIQEAAGGAMLLTTAVSDAAQIGSFVLGSGDSALPGLAFWSLNRLGGETLEDAFVALRQRSAKPFLISAFGIDAFDGRINAEDGATQGSAARKLAGSIELRTEGSFYPLLGGVWAGFADEWWRGGGAPDRHGIAGVAAGGFPDGFRNDGWLGLFGLRASSLAGLDSLRPRDAYFALSGVWGGSPPPELTISSPPSLNPGGVTHLATRRTTIAPGSLVAWNGASLSSSNRAAANATLPNQLGTTSACIGGSPAPLYFAGPGIVRGQAPLGLAPGPVETIVFRAGQASNAAQVNVAAVAPGILDGGVIRSGRPCPVDLNNGVRPGDYIEVYSTGLGAVDAERQDGLPLAAPAFPLSMPASRLAIRDLDVAYTGLVPGLNGVYQSNIKIPDDFPPQAADLFLMQGEAISNSYPLRIVSRELNPAFFIAAPKPGTVFVQAGGPPQTMQVQIEGRDAFCDLVRFQLIGLPAGVQARIPVGLPGQTVPLSVWAGADAPRAESVLVEISAVSIVPGDRRQSFRVTVLPSKGDIRFVVRSGGFRSGVPLASFEMEGRILYRAAGGGPGRGFNFLTIDASSGALGEFRNFDTWGDEGAVKAMESYLRSLGPASVVLGAVADEGSLLITGETRRVIAETLGSQLIANLGYQQSWAIISRAGSQVPFAEGHHPVGTVVLDRWLSFPMP